MAKSLDEVLAQMRGYGLEPPLKVDLKDAFTKFVRWCPPGQKAAKKTAWARLHSWVSPTTQVEYISGAFGCRGDVWHVESSNSDWSPAERAAEMEARKAADKAAEAERVKDAAAAADKASVMWKRARDADQSSQHQYLVTKRVSAFGLRVAFQRLMVPLRDLQGALHGLQYIDPDGAKLFGTGTIKESHFHLIGDVLPDQPIAFGEGYATCATGHMATGWPVVTCFDAGNLEPVVAAWRKLYPDHTFVILADDDRFLMQRLAERLLKQGITVAASELKAPIDRSWEVPDGPKVECKAAWKDDANGGPMRLEGSITVDGQVQMVKIENAGMAKAALVAKRHKAVVVAPRFGPDAKGTDWNDLLVDVGLEATREALLKAFAAPPPVKKRANGAPQAAAAKAAAQAKTDENSMTFWERFTLIYGTTTVWDAHERKIIKLEALKVAFGKIVDIWLASDERNMVPSGNVVFDPTCELGLPKHVNLFDRLPVEPDPKGNCAGMLRHIYTLCGESDPLYHWFLCWLAYPLQHPGAKMRTSVILFGRTEGTGKSLATDWMREIYGVYARTITQRQLESEFNAWQSAMLFCVAEEVVSRQDRAHLQGLIQNMITNKVIQINEKNLPLRQEVNYTNFIFHSNGQVPMLLNDTDRRFTVIKAEQEHDQAYFQALGEEADNGGSAALMHYLLEYDVGDFNEHTRPVVNTARMNLITLGMQPDRRFFEYWSTGHAEVPFVSCASRDLYSAFKAWCKVSGERYVAHITAFGLTITEQLERLGAPPKKSVRFQTYSDKAIEAGIHPNDVTMTKQGIVYFVPMSVQRKANPAKFKDLPDDPNPPDCTEPTVYNKDIDHFQYAMCDLIASARRAF